MMEMSIARPRRDLLPGTSAIAGAPGNSDLRAVTYNFVAPGGPASGLVRTEGERMAVEVLETNGTIATQISSARF